MEELASEMSTAGFTAENSANDTKTEEIGVETREIWALIMLTVGNDNGTHYLPWEMVGATAGVVHHSQCLDICFNPMSDNYLRLY